MLRSNNKRQTNETPQYVFIQKDTVGWPAKEWKYSPSYQYLRHISDITITSFSIWMLNYVIVSNMSNFKDRKISYFAHGI